eukprot:gene13048-9341_t
MDDNNLAAAVYHELENVYRQIPPNGKPDKDNVFTVLAGFVAVIGRVDANPADAPLIEVLSLATGTKCVSEDMIDDRTGLVVHDSHAEVLARRGLIRYLAEVIYQISLTPTFVEDVRCPLQLNRASDSGESPRYRWKDTWRLFLCISDSPCGDGTIYGGQEGVMTFTGAKLAAAPSTRSSSEVADNGGDSNLIASDLCIREPGTQITIAQTGLLQGSTSKALRQLGDMSAGKIDVLASRLSRRSLHSIYEQLQRLSTSNASEAVSGSESVYAQEAYEARKRHVHRTYSTFQRAYDAFFHHPFAP